MDEETTTLTTVDEGAQIQGIPVDDQGNAQPEATEPVEAVETTEPTESQPAQTAEPSDDEQLQKFAENKGLTLDSDNAIKAAKMAMNAEKAMHQKAQKASELEKTAGQISDEYAEQNALATGQDPDIVKRLQRIEVQNSVKEFWNTPVDESGNLPDKSLEPAMVELIREKPYLAGDLEALYATAMVKSGGASTLKSQGKREALESLAQKQQAAVPSGNAVNQGVSPTAITPQNVDALVAQNSLEWFEANRDAINKAMAG